MAWVMGARHLKHKQRRLKPAHRGRELHLASHKILFEPMEPRLLLSADPVLSNVSQSVVQIAQHPGPTSTNGGFIVDVTVNNTVNKTTTTLIYIQRYNEMPRDLMYPQGEYLGVFRRRFGAQSAATIALNSPAWD